MELKAGVSALQLFILTFVFPCLFSGIVVTQSIEPVKKRADTLLTAAREKRWDEMYEYTIIATGKQDQATRKRMGISDSATPDEIRQKVAEWFKRLYNNVRPGGAGNIRFLNKEKTHALISYWHEDLDAFHMVFVDGEWYYTLEY